jgi:hypothetical protein
MKAETSRNIGTNTSTEAQVPRMIDTQLQDVRPGPREARHEESIISGDQSAVFLRRCAGVACDHDRTRHDRGTK